MNISPGSHRCEVFVAFTAFKFLLGKTTSFMPVLLLSNAILKAISKSIYTKEDVNFR